MTRFEALLLTIWCAALCFSMLVARHYFHGHHHAPVILWSAVLAAVATILGMLVQLSEIISPKKGRKGIRA